MFKNISIAATAIAATVALSQAACAHSPHDVQHMLQDRGYSQLEFTSTDPSNYMVNACRAGRRHHVHVNYYGEVTERRDIGPCYAEPDLPRRHGWTNWRNRY